jgi:predicted nucleotidyltransferase
MQGVTTNQFANWRIDAPTMLRLVRDIMRRFDPEKIILFGSYAYGEPTEDSDLDLLVVMPHRGPGHRMATKIRLSVGVKFPMDLLVRSSAELHQGVSQRDWFIVEILEKGITLHDRANPAMGAQGRSRLRRRLASARIHARATKQCKKWTEKQLLKGVTPAMCGPDLIANRVGRELV